MRRAELVTAICLAIFSVYVMWKSGQPAWPGDPWFANIAYVKGEGPGGGFWPFYLALGMLLCSVWIVVNWARRTSPPSRSEEPFLDSYGKTMLLKVGGAVFLLIFLVDGVSSFVQINYPDVATYKNGFPVPSIAWLWELPIGIVLRGGGMYLSMALFLFYYVRFLGRHRMITSLAIAIGGPILTFFFFDVAMRITLPKGYLDPFFVPLYAAFL